MQYIHLRHSQVLKVFSGFFTKYSAIIVALIAFIGVVAQLCISSKTNSRNQEFQREWEQKKINVD